MSALVTLKDIIRDVRNSCKEFSAQGIPNVPSEKLGDGTFTFTDAVFTFEDLLQSVESSIDDPRGITKHIANDEMIAVANVISSLSSAFLSRNYEEFVSTLDSSIIHFRPFAMLSMGKKALTLRAFERLNVEFDDQAKELKSNQPGWLITGIASSLIASALGWVTLNTSLEWQHVLSRFLLMSIFLGLSAFAFRQYSKNKSLEYDYVFKSSLVNSYPDISSLFDYETRKKYADKLTIEILRDPQRIRSSKIINLTSKEEEQHE